MPYPNQYSTFGNNMGWGQYPQPTYPNYTQYQQPTNGLIRVTGMEGAKAFRQPPNTDTILFDGEEPIFFLKSTDGAGFPTIRTFRYDEIQMTEQKIDTSQYVSRAEFDALVERLTRNDQSDIPESTEQSGTKQHFQSNRQPKANGNRQS